MGTQIELKCAAAAAAAAAATAAAAAAAADDDDDDDVGDEDCRDNFLRIIFTVKLSLGTFFL